MSGGFDFAPQAVLFACTMNRVRSPMAAALLRRLAPGRLYVDSCGVRGGAEEDPLVAAILAERGIELEPQHPKTFEAVGASAFDLIVCLSREAETRAREIARAQAVDVLFWEIADPTREEGARAARLDAYRDVRNDLERRMRTRFAPVLAARSTSS